MGNEVATRTAGLPANLGNMASALQTAVQTSGASGGDLYLKMTRDGEWVYGAEETELEEGAVMAVNPLAFKHGWTCWGSKARGNEGENLGEIMVPATEPAPLEASLPEKNGDWSQCVSAQLRITNGEDEGIQLLWKTNSVGGRKAWAALVQQIIAQMGQGTDQVVALVTMTADSYKHKTYGKIYTPEIAVVGWENMEGTAAQSAPAAAIEADEEAEHEPEAAEEEEAPPRRRRRVASEN